MSSHHLAHPSRCTICNSGRYIVPPCYKCDVHGPMCTGCRNIKGGCPFCRRAPTRDFEADKLLNTHIALVCVNEPDCDLAFPSFWYDEHYRQCPLNQNNDLSCTCLPVYVPLERNQNPALEKPRRIRYERDLQIAANKRERRRRNRQRRKEGTTNPPKKWPKGEFRPE